MNFTVRRLTAAEAASAIQKLADILLDVVEGGASVGFMAPLPLPKAESFWRRVAEGVANGTRALMIAEEVETGEALGTAQVIWDLPENQPHRADVSKVLVKRRARGFGVGAALMRAADQAARDAGKTLLVLDTASDAAERLYQREGWVRVGPVPDFALLPDGRLCDTVIYYKRLSPGRAPQVHSTASMPPST